LIRGDREEIGPRPINSYPLSVSKTGGETSQIIRSGLILVIKDSAEKGGTAYAIGKGFSTII
jgi:hypothetical protein